ncbi:UNVERIFIED_ORG: hypothetical protein FNL38_10510 [Nocardia globerula]|uniref:Uncharacterized protein n=1 Tax=Nocardia globerula TaxID=1818 RepID=A0A652YLV9_NOCGL|nr:hypothetical protein [Rhodococcus globerulus]NMD62074.1 hypothetical protein [Nocardia globerula]PVX65837.1 hypothetical protein C8E04_3149 [Rhodococcus globerulus]
MTTPFTVTYVEHPGPAADSGLWYHPNFEPKLFKTLMERPGDPAGLARRGIDAVCARLGRQANGPAKRPSPSIGPVNCDNDLN